MWCRQLLVACRMWKPGQPDNWGHGHDISGEDCAGLVHEALWNDFFCEDPISYICEKELEQCGWYGFIVLRVSWKWGLTSSCFCFMQRDLWVHSKVLRGIWQGAATPLCGSGLPARHRRSRYGEQNRTIFDLSPGLLQLMRLQCWREAFVLRLWRNQRRTSGFYWIISENILFLFCIPCATKYLNVYFITQVCRKL